MFKHSLQNRTNVQIKGGGCQRPFEQCSKKLHFSYPMASLMYKTHFNELQMLDFSHWISTSDKMMVGR